MNRLKIEIKVYLRLTNLENNNKDEKEEKAF